MIIELIKEGQTYYDEKIGSEIDSEVIYYEVAKGDVLQVITKWVSNDYFDGKNYDEIWEMLDFNDNVFNAFLSEYDYDIKQHFLAEYEANK